MSEEELSSKMSSDEEGSDVAASDIEGEEQVVLEIDEGSNEEDDESESDAEKEAKLKEKLENLVKEWKERMPRGKKRKDKDHPPRRKVLFSPSSIIESFNQFMTTELKELILKFTNLKGMCSFSSFFLF